MGVYGVAHGEVIVDPEARRDLEALEAIAENSRITQRGLSTKLGIALGLANLYVKRLVRKGYVKCVNFKPNRILYVLTPTGITEKTRLTYEFMEYSMFLYGQVRQHLRSVLQPFTEGQRRRVAIYGTGEAAELAYLSLTELGMELVAVLDGVGADKFLGRPVQDIREQHTVDYDLIIVATLEQPDAMVERLLSYGVPREKIVMFQN